jgi:beta-phosphoglucomutase-like phosphatase (HAD superfamily)
MVITNAKLILIFLIAAQQLGIKPENAIVLKTLAGVQAANIAK